MKVTLEDHSRGDDGVKMITPNCMSSDLNRARRKCRCIFLEGERSGMG